MKITKIIWAISLMILMIIHASCKKYLEAKPDKTLALATSLDDLEALLDNYNNINKAFPATIMIGTDDYFIDDVAFNSNSAFENALYLWHKADSRGDEWVKSYRAISMANIVLEELEKQTHLASDLRKYNTIKGNASFLRGYLFYWLQESYGQPYNKDIAEQTLSIPLRLSSDINIPSKRSTVKVCYDQIISDLKIASELLPEQPDVKTRASKGAAYGALAKVFLSMGNFISASDFVNKALSLNSNLIDYNAISPNSQDPFPIFNEEVVYHIESPFPVSALQARNCNIDTNLYRLYDNDDLRKTLFFNSKGNQLYSFKGGYNGYNFGLTYIFGGIATDELYLTRAECYARAGELDAAKNDLNKLMLKRYKTGKYIPLTSGDQAEVLKKILTERRKELIFRASRWTDLRRFLNESEHVVTLKRLINGKEYTLTPGSPSYTLAIPASVISITGMEQNP